MKQAAPAQHIGHSPCKATCPSSCLVDTFQVDLTYLDRRELTAFFINIYNALVIHGMVLFGPADSTLKRCVTVPSASTTAVSATV